jgi:hypothetical protein
MPTALRWFAEYQPFTPFIETVRGLLLGTAIGNSAVLTIGWSVGITLVSFVWAKRLYNRDPSERKMYSHEAARYHRQGCCRARSAARAAACSSS